MNQFGWNLANLCTYQCKAGGGLGGRQGMGWGFDCLCWPWGRAFNWSYSPIASPQPSFGVRSSRIHFSLTSTGEKWMREERTQRMFAGRLVLPGEGLFESFFTHCGDINFDCRLRQKRLRWNMCFPVSMLHACTILSGKIWKSWSPTRTSERWVDFTVLSSNFVYFSVFLISWTF